MKESFRLESKKLDALIAYLQEKDLNAHMRIIEDVELLEATTKEGTPCRYHWDTVFFEHMSVQRGCELIDKYISKR